MRIGCYQFNPIAYDIEQNVSLICNVIKETMLDLIVFPELSLTGYIFESRDQLRENALPIDSPWLLKLKQCSLDTQTAIVLGYAELDSYNGKIYNSSICFRPGLDPVTYRKSHLFDRETLVFDSGDSGFFTFDYKSAKIGMLVCFDHYFPEAARSLMLQGAQIICHPSNLVLEGAAQLTTRVRSMENRIFWCLCNRCGTQQDLNFTGGSQITDPKGEVLCSASRDRTELISFDITPKMALNKQISKRNDIIEDRRMDIYTL